MNARGQRVDRTFLSLDNAEERGFIHRDYIAHCLRWTHVVKRMTKQNAYKTARLLDIGCGRELPLPRLLYTSRHVVEHYYGVDAGPIEDEPYQILAQGKMPISVWDKTDFLDLTLDDLDGIPVNWVTSFEVLEHVEPGHMLRILKHLKSLCSPDVTILISTPCWNRVDCAANHVNEMLYDALGAVFESMNFQVMEVYGTFASIRDYEEMLSGWPGLPALFEKLRKYYDSNFLSCVFAPIFPHASRNALWVLSPGLHDKKFPDLKTIPGPWGSSSRWMEMDKDHEANIEALR